jgi:hypothetical protein
VKGSLFENTGRLICGCATVSCRPIYEFYDERPRSKQRLALAASPRRRRASSPFFSCSSLSPPPPPPAIRAGVAVRSSSYLVLFIFSRDPDTSPLCSLLNPTAPSAVCLVGSPLLLHGGGGGGGDLRLWQRRSGCRGGEEWSPPRPNLRRGDRRHILETPAGARLPWSSHDLTILSHIRPRRQR